MSSPGPTSVHWCETRTTGRDPAGLALAVVGSSQPGDHQNRGVSTRPRIAAPALLDLLASGKVCTYRFTIVEGWSVKQLLDALQETLCLSTRDSTSELETPGGFPKVNSEGWFSARNLCFVRGDSDLHILETCLRDMQESLASHLGWS